MENAVKLARCIEMDQAGVLDIESVLHPTIAYIEDELKSRPQLVWLADSDPRPPNSRSAGKANGASRFSPSARASARPTATTAAC